MNTALKTLAGTVAAALLVVAGGTLISAPKGQGVIRAVASAPQTPASAPAKNTVEKAAKKKKMQRFNNKPQKKPKQRKKRPNDDFLELNK